MPEDPLRDDQRHSAASHPGRGGVPERVHVGRAIDADAVAVSARDGAAQFVGLVQSAPTGANTLRSDAVMARPRRAACTS